VWVHDDDADGMRIYVVGRIVTDVSQFYIAYIFRVTRSRITTRGLKSRPGLDVVTDAGYLSSVFLKHSWRIVPHIRLGTLPSTCFPIIFQSSCSYAPYKLGC
jgi:hypothetical protein